MKHTLIKVVYNDMSNIDEQYVLSQRCSSFGRIYEIVHISLNTKIISMEYISDILTLSVILEQPEPFQFLYRMTLDYLYGLSALHSSGYIHSSIKPIQLLVGSQGKLVGLDDIIPLEPHKEFYFDTGGSINYLAPERYEYFEKTGFFGMTSCASDIWELFYSILCIIDVIVLDEFFELLYGNFDILASYLLNRLVKKFRIDCSMPILDWVEKYVKTLVVGLQLQNRPPVEWYIYQLLSYKAI